MATRELTQTINLHPQRAQINDCGLHLPVKMENELKRKGIWIPSIIPMLVITILTTGCLVMSQEQSTGALSAAAEGVTVISLADAGPGKIVASTLADGGASVTDGRLERPTVERGALVVMDSAWLQANKTDPATTEYIKDAVNAGAGIVVSGENTSELYDLLRSLNLSQFEDGRNPMHSDPPMVGFWIETHDSGEVTVHRFGSNTDDLELQAINAARWIKGEAKDL